MDFFTSKWPCPNLDLAGPTSYSLSKTEKPSTPGTLHFKFSALNPQLILLADESDPFSRALVLKGFAVAHINIVKDEASSMPANAEIDLRSTTTLIGHLKHLETTVHHNIDSLIGPNRDVTRSATADDSQALIEPVTITFEFTVVNRKRFPTSRFLSIEIDPVATLLSFGDLNLIDTVIKKLRKKASAKMKSGSKNDNLKTKLKNAQEAPLTPAVKRYESLLLPNKSSDYDEYDMRPITLDIVISTEKLGLSLRKSGSSIVVDSSLSNPHVQVGDILISVNGSSVARLPLPSIVELLASLPRPVTVTLERKSTKPPPYNPRFYDAGNASESLSFDASFDALDSPSSERGGINDDESECACSSQEHMEPLSVRFNLLCRGGMPNGLEIREGIAGAPVITSIDYDLIAQCAISSKYLTDGGSMRHMSTHKESTRVAHDDVTDRQPLKRLPLPGAVLLAIEGKEVTYEDMHLVLRPRESQEMDGSTYTLTFVEADSSSWQGVTTFNLLLSLKITLIDDTNGRDMPVLRAGIKESSVNAEHGLGTVTTTIDARRPTLLSLAPDADSTRYTNKRTMTIKSDTRSFNVEYYNALINQWEPLIEPHYIGALAERQGGNGFHTGLFSIVLTDHIRSIEPTHPTPIDFVCINVSLSLFFS